MQVEEEDFEDSSDKGLRLVPVDLPSRLALEGAVCALRMIEGEGWHARLLRRNRLREDDALMALGLESDPTCGCTIGAGKLREILTLQRRRLERKLRCVPDSLSRNIQKLGAILKLNSAECTILRFSVIATNTKNFSDLFQVLLTSRLDLMRAVRSATGLRRSEVAAAMANNRTLRRTGFYENWQESFNSNPLELKDAVVDALLARELDEERFLRRLVRAAPPSALSLADFAHLPDLALLKRYLGDATTRRRKGVNILLYGAPGTGKTEFVRVLGPALGLSLYEVPNEDADGDPISGRGRFGAYSVCQNLLASRRNQLLMFDEVEDVFGSGHIFPGSMFGFGRARDPDQLRKSWVNETLEKNPVPAVWVCNSIDAIDPAFVRRFDLIVEFTSPTRSVRRRVINRYFREGEISAECADRLATISDLPPAHVERAARVVRSLRARSTTRRDAEVQRVIASSMKAMGHRKVIPAPTLPEHYDPAFLNTDCDLSEIAAGLKTTSGARLCLYGPPGTGKTAFAHHLGRVIDRPVVVKRGSDLLSMWVGGTEELIAKSFREAESENAILVIDEADGFLRDRTGARQSWEVTQVNELLTQMEAFEGIFIASTNLVDTLDVASLRRFDFKVRFNSLTRSQRQAMLRRICGERVDGISEALDVIARIDGITPGDFANVLRQLRVTGASANPPKIVALLAAEAKMKPDSRKSIGFVAA